MKTSDDLPRLWLYRWDGIPESYRLWRGSKLTLDVLWNQSHPSITSPLPSRRPDQLAVTGFCGQIPSASSRGPALLMNSVVRRSDIFASTGEGRHARLPPATSINELIGKQI